MPLSSEQAKRIGKLGGRPKGSRTALSMKIDKAKDSLIQMYIEKIRPINAALILKAEQGDIQAIRELHDRVYGRPLQAVDAKIDLVIKQIQGMKIVKE